MRILCARRDKYKTRFYRCDKKGIGRNCKIVGNDRYRRLLRELAMVNISIRYTLPRIYTSEEKWGKRSLRR